MAGLPSGRRPLLEGILKRISIRERLMASTVAGTAAVLVMAAVPAVALLAPSMAIAQDYTSGALTGSVADTAGAPVAGASITIRSVSQGFTRTVTSDSTGSFRFQLLPLGEYEISSEASGYATVSDKVRVNVGESRFALTLGSEGAAQVDDIVVTGVRAELSFAATTKGTVIDVAELTEQVPIARNITAVTLLAPTVVPGTGSASFGNLPSIGGSTVAENAYYLNGLNITNFDTYVGSATVPFDFYRTVEVKTGGYPAEYGRATGGVVNAISKSGTNEFMFAAHANYTPNALAEESPDTESSFGNTYGTRDFTETKDFTIEAGGPIIRDRLFAYGLYQWRELESNNALNATYTKRVTDAPFWGAKIDANVIEGHRLEFTYFNTEATQTNSPFNYTASTDTVGAAGAQTFLESGGENYVGKYTGNLTDWLTISAAYGVSNIANSVLPENTTDSRITEARFTTVDANGNPLPAASRRPAFTSSGQRTRDTIINDAERVFYRFDADMYFQLFGEHHVRMGYDNESNTLNKKSEVNGGRYYTLRRGTGLNAGYGVAAGQDFLEVSYRTLGGLDLKSENESYYLQDAWDVTDTLSLQLGLRYDAFLVEGLSREKSFDLDGNWGPRVGFTWDPFGNGTDKVYGSYGRYFIPPAANMAYRGGDLGFSEFFLLAPGTAEGVIPTRGAQITTTNPQVNGARFEQQTHAGACPAGGYGPEGAIGCQITLGRGLAERAFSKTSQELEATNEDEFILGYTRQVNDLWTVGGALTYRKLNKVSEDITLDPFISQYCADNGYNVAACEARWDGSWQYVVINPGEDITIYTRGALPGDPNPTCFGPVPGTPALTDCGTLITLTAEELGYDLPKREYLGLELNFERAFDGKWGLQGSYVLSRSVGNYEGTVLSDFGQADAGTTQLFDYPGLADFQDGPLPNHRLHQFKLFGSYQVLPDLLVGANLSVVSPQKYGCLGIHPTDSSAAAYGASSRYCGGQPAYRGSRIESDWLTRFDLSFRYKVPVSVPGDLVLRADVFNVFNLKGAQELDETYDEDGVNMLPTYGSVVTYQTPRLVRFGMDWKF